MNDIQTGRKKVSENIAALSEEQLEENMRAQFMKLKFLSATYQVTGTRGGKR